MPWKIVLSGLVSMIVVAGARAEEVVGERPYEMVWANRTEDTRRPLLDFENLEGWTVECDQAEAEFRRSREQQIWGKYVGTLTYRGTGNQPVVTVRPPRPVPIVGPFDCINFWVYGNNWAWVPDPTTPQVEVRVVLEGPGGQRVPVSMGRVRWREWWVMHRRLSADQLALLEDGARLVAIEVLGGRNEDDRVLHFDNLAVYEEPLPPLEFEPRPKRGIDLPEGQTVGTNIGPGRLPFPTRAETILPDNLTDRFEVSLESAGGEFVFRYRGDDGELVYRYRPATGTLGDVTAEWVGRSSPFRPLVDGGVYFATESGSAPPEKIEAVSCRREGDAVTSTWKCTLGQRAAEVTYSFRLWQKSLVVDVRCPGGEIGEFRVGKAVGVEEPRLVTVPYLVGDQHRPAVLVTGAVEKPLFVFAQVDHCRSNASALWFANRVADDGATYNGGARYLPKTDGNRNPCFERLFVTVSPRFEEILPNIPNPKSPWMHVAGERLWRAHGASNRQRDYEHWKKVARHGMTKVVITDHEVGWRDGGESFTMRTRAAPGKGGDEGQAEYARTIRALGFRYGIYNNYTDYAPVNEHWNEDWVTRLSDGEWRTAWPRCYNPKPARAVEIESRLAPIIQEKFQLDTAYCDVHTAVAPWSYCDFDARVPGAGTFAATFYAYGEIMLHQKKTWNGPVYSEGNNHWYYCGLTDGNYGQDQRARLDVNPWLVDFDLLKMHPLCCNFGMGNLGMFYGRDVGIGKTPEERERRLDRFLAATLAFGHTGFLVFEGGFENAVRSYFNLQQVHAHYAQETATSIRYADEEGDLLDTTAAVASGAFRRSQVAVEYSNGLKVIVNGHPSETWTTPDAVLPPDGWYVEKRGQDPFSPPPDAPKSNPQEPKKGPVPFLLAYSAMVDGRRADYVDSPAYRYADGRGRFTRFDKVACDGQLIVHKHADGACEVIPVGDCSDFGVSFDGRTATAVALDEAGDELGPAETRLSRGLVYVVPIDGAMSYRLAPGAPPEVKATCDRLAVVPGEKTTIEAKTSHAFEVPAEAKPGERLWHQVDGAWIDFDVRPLVTASLRVAEALSVVLTPHLGQPADAEIRLGGQSQTVRLVPETTVRVDFDWREPQEEQVREIRLAVAAGDLSHRQSWWLKSERTIVPIAMPSNEFATGQRLRGGDEKSLGDETMAHVHWTERSCGGQTRHCLFMHPPYRGGVGYVFALFEPIELPDRPAAAFRCDIGKADGSDSGDGILFQIAVADADGTETVVAEKQWIDHAWTPLEADLSPWAGRSIRLKLVADVGPADNSSGDWACWSNLRIESLGPTLVTTVHDQPVKLAREPGPHALADLTQADLARARSGWLHYRGMGLENGGRYVSHGRLNGIALGPLPGAGGIEGQGIWSDAALELPPEAIASLGESNRFAIDNPGGDNFKIGRFWIEIELPDGRKASSQITNAVYTQPPEWPHAEGTLVPFGENIEAEIRFALTRE